MGILGSVNEWLAGFFALASVHYAIQWWFSRYERVFLVFSIQCALYSAFCVATVSLVRASTIPDVQAALDRVMTLGVGLFVVVLQFYACVGGRRDHAFRALVTLVIVVLVGINQWVPLRGTVIALEPMPLPTGEMAWLPIRSPPGALLGLTYLATTTVQGYGLFVARGLSRRDRTGAVLVAIGASASLVGASIAVLVDFAKMRAPYPGALPHAIFVLAMALFLAREYSARGVRVAATERKFEAAFEHSPIGKALLSPDGRFLRVNRALCPLLGTTIEEICSRRLHEVVREDDDGSIEEETRRLLAGEIGTCTLERRLVRRDGELSWALLSVSVVPDDRGQPVHLIAQIQDVTEVRAYREKLEELVATRTRELHEAKDEAERASQAKSRFLANMSHEIRSPLHGILMTAELLQVELEADQRKDIDTLYTAAKHLATVINDVLEMSRIEAGHLELIEGPFDLGATLDEVAEMFASQTAAKGTELIIETTPELPRTLRGDGVKVRQVLINLLSNAVKFTEKGSIRVAATWRALEDKTTLMEVLVADTGIGIAEQDVERMFQPFEQLDAGARTGGTGLGLGISLAFARLMGGELRVESAPGVGSRFTFTFVAKRVPPEAVRESSARPKHFTSTAMRYKVLIVDDMEVNRGLLAATLTKSAFETRSAADGPTALSIHAEWSPDVVLMDLRMPGMNGLETIRRLRADGSRAAIVALTAAAFGDDEREAVDAGADFFIRKPCTAWELLGGVACAVAARGTVA